MCRGGGGEPRGFLFDCPSEIVGPHRINDAFKSPVEFVKTAIYGNIIWQVFRGNNSSSRAPAGQNRS
jgi:hypothetical protein